MLPLTRYVRVHQIALVLKTWRVWLLRPTGSRERLARITVRHRSWIALGLLLRPCLPERRHSIEEEAWQAARRIW